MLRKGEKMDNKNRKIIEELKKEKPITDNDILYYSDYHYALYTENELKDQAQQIGIDFQTYLDELIQFDGYIKI
jgi:hypothetical protein